MCYSNRKFDNNHNKVALDSFLPFFKIKFIWIEKSFRWKKREWYSNVKQIKNFNIVAKINCKNKLVQRYWPSLVILLLKNYNWCWFRCIQMSKNQINSIDFQIFYEGRNSKNSSIILKYYFVCIKYNRTE